MSEWRVEFHGKSENDLSNLDRSIRRRIIDRVEWLSKNFDGITPIPLSGEWRGFFKLRMGDWRIIYTINEKEKLVAIHYIDNRAKVYKRRK